jgi:hypothetical protein
LRWEMAPPETKRRWMAQVMSVVLAVIAATSRTWLQGMHTNPMGELSKQCSRKEDTEAESTEVSERGAAPWIDLDFFFFRNPKSEWDGFSELTSVSFMAPTREEDFSSLREVREAGSRIKPGRFRLKQHSKSPWAGNDVPLGLILSTGWAIQFALAADTLGRRGESVAHLKEVSPGGGGGDFKDSLLAGRSEVAREARDLELISLCWGYCANI